MSAGGVEVADPDDGLPCGCLACRARAAAQRLDVLPSVGRIVHYLSRGSADGVYAPACRAAVITAVIDELSVSLAVLNPTGLYFDQDVQYDNRGALGSWHWPERA